MVDLNTLSDLELLEYLRETKEEFKTKLYQKVKQDLLNGEGCPTDFIFGMVRWEIENEQKLSEDSVKSLLFLIEVNNLQK